MTKKTLLEIAKDGKAEKRKTKFSDQEIELALAFLNNELGTVQVLRALQKTKTNSTSAYCFITTCLRYAISTGKIKIQ